jgi:hypothetical protein
MAWKVDLPNTPVRCGICRYAVLVNEHGFYCHRYPPKASVTLDRDGNQCWDNLRPFVTAEEWCGEGIVR